MRRATLVAVSEPRRRVTAPYANEHKAVQDGQTVNHLTSRTGAARLRRTAGRLRGLRRAQTASAGLRRPRACAPTCLLYTSLEARLEALERAVGGIRLPAIPTLDLAPTQKRLDDLEPVSYTHLDVYKRQRRARSARANSPRRVPGRRCRATRCASSRGAAKSAAPTSPGRRSLPPPPVVRTRPLPMPRPRADATPARRARPDPAAAVSYTHLDVYKRQPIGRDLSR